HRTDQTEVALLDQIQEEHAAARVALGQGDHETEVRLEQVILGGTAVVRDHGQLAAGLGEAAVLVPERVIALELLLGVQTRLDPLGELDLLGGVEQRNLADLLEVVLDRVRGGTGRDDLLRGGVVLRGVVDEPTGGFDLLVRGRFALATRGLLGRFLRLGAAAFFAAASRGADERVDDFVAVVVFAVVLEVEAAVSVSTASASVPFAAFVAAARVGLFAVGEVSAVLEEVTEFLLPAAARVG